MINKRDFCIPVLMYHHVNPAGSFINVKPNYFESHIRYLKEHGYNALNTFEFFDIFNGIRSAPERPVMITFDDGWLDNWIFAYPVLKKYQMKAVIFIITSWIHEQGKRRRSDEGNTAGIPPHKECQKMVDEGYARDVMLSWEEIREMKESGLVDFQSHTHSHRRWDKLFPDSETRKKALEVELKISKQLIEDKLGSQCNALCWPWGRHDKDYIETAISSGYKMMFTTEKGTNTCITDLHAIRRIVIGNISPFNFRKKLFIYSRDWLSRLYLKIS